MIDDELFKTQKAWAEQSLLLLRELLPLMSPVGQHSDWTREERYTVGLLLSATARSSESVLLLSAYGQLWDAEVLVRSVFEGTLKLAYLLQSRDQFKQRHTEYARDLFQIALLKDHRKALKLLEALPDPDARYWQPIRERLLPKEDQQRIKAEYDVSVQRSLNSRWGFAGLLSALSRSDNLICGAQQNESVFTQ